MKCTHHGQKSATAKKREREQARARTENEAKWRKARAKQIAVEQAAEQAGVNLPKKPPPPPIKKAPNREVWETIVTESGEIYYGKRDRGSLEVSLSAWTLPEGDVANRPRYPLMLTIHEATELHDATSMFKGMKPFVHVICENQVAHVTPEGEGKNPSWHEGEMQIRGAKQCYEGVLPTGRLEFRVFEHQMMGSDRIIGTAFVNLAEVMGGTREMTLDMEDCEGCGSKLRITVGFPAGAWGFSFWTAKHAQKPTNTKEEEVAEREAAAAAEAAAGAEAAAAYEAEIVAWEAAVEAAKNIHTEAAPASEAAPAAKTAAAAEAVNSASTAEMILQIFMDADTDGNGTIERDELQKVMKALFGDAWTDEMLDSMFAAADADQDGVVDYDEFVAWLFEDKELAKQMLGEELANEPKAKGYKPASAETLYVPASKPKARLVLREQAFSYVSNFSARFSEGVQGTYIRDGQAVTLSPTHFGEFSDTGENETLEFTVTVGVEPLDGKFAGCFSMTLPEEAENCWLDS